MICDFARDTKGGTLMLTALFLGLLAGVCAIAVDYGYAVVIKQRLQGSADSAALAAIFELPDTNATQTTAINYASMNMPVDIHGTVLVAADVEPGSWNSDDLTFTTGGADPDAVRVTTRRAQANGNAWGLFFARMIGKDNTDVSAVAIASKMTPTQCVVALEPNDVGITVNADSSLTTVDCGVHVNSSNGSAIETNSGSTVTAGGGADICTVGGYSGGGFSPAPQTGCAPIADPLASLDPPPYGGCDHTNKVEVNNGEVVTLNPGRYCAGITVNAGGTANFNPGNYIIEGDKFLVNTNSTAQGSEVHFYLNDKDALMNFNSDSTVNFSAPTSGDMAGVLFFMNRDISDEMKHEINSDSSSALSGTVYLPTGDLMINSEGVLGGDGACTIIVVLQLEVNSDSTLSIDDDFDGCGVPVPDSMAIVRLVR